MPFRPLFALVRQKLSKTFPYRIVSNVSSPPTIVMAPESLVSQLNANHQILVAKLTEIETRVAQFRSRPSPPTLSMGGDDAKQAIDSERQRLAAENQQLRMEIQRLIERLAQLEQAAVTGKEQISLPPQSQSQPVMQPEPEVVKQPQPSPSGAATAESKPAGNKKDNKKKPAGEVKPKEDEKQKKEQQPKQTKTEAKTKKPESAAAAAAAEERAIDASRLDLRVGKIIDVKKHPDADSLYVEQIECGEERPRTVVSGLVKFVPIEQMQNRMVVILCNLKPAKMRGVVSEAMVMCASTPDKVEILSPPEGSAPGDRVTFERYPGAPDQQLNPKKKIWEQIAPDLKTNEQLEATYKGDAFVVAGKGAVKAETLKNVAVK